MNLWLCDCQFSPRFHSQLFRALLLRKISFAKALNLSSLSTILAQHPCIEVRLRLVNQKFRIGSDLLEPDNKLLANGSGDKGVGLFYPLSIHNLSRETRVDRHNHQFHFCIFC